MKNKTDIFNYLMMGYNLIQPNEDTVESMALFERGMRSLGINQDLIDQAVENKRNQAADSTLQESEQKPEPKAKSNGMVRFVMNTDDMQKKNQHLREIVKRVDEESKEKNKEPEEEEIQLIEGTEISADELQQLINKAKGEGGGTSVEDTNVEEQEESDASILVDIFAKGIDEVKKDYKSCRDFANFCKQHGMEIDNNNTWKTTWSEFESKMQVPA